MRVADASIWQSVGYVHAGTGTQWRQAEPAQSCGGSVWERTGSTWSVAVARGQVETYAGVEMIQCITIDNVLWNSDRVGFEGRGSHRERHKEWEARKPEERKEALLSANWQSKVYILVVGFIHHWSQ